MDRKEEGFMKRFLAILGVCLVVIGLTGCAGTEYLKGFLGLEEAQAHTVYDLGDVYPGDGVAISYEMCETWEGYNKYSVPEEGYEYIRVGFVIENQSDAVKPFGSVQFACYADGVEMKQHHSVNYEDAMRVSAPVDAGETMKGNVYFKVPVDAEEIVVVFTRDNLSDAEAGFRVK